MSSFDPVVYGPAVAELLHPPRLQTLGPGQPNNIVQPLLEALTVTKLLAPHAVHDAEMAHACLAALWLYHDFLDLSHEISQQIATPTGSYWHGIMHRREPDYGNAAYWFRRVGVHPVFAPLGSEAARLSPAGAADAAIAQLRNQNSWNPFHFIAMCEASAGGQAKEVGLCRALQQREWELLFDFCYRGALA